MGDREVTDRPPPNGQVRRVAFALPAPVDSDSTISTGRDTEPHSSMTSSTSSSSSDSSVSGSTHDRRSSADTSLSDHLGRTASDTRYLITSQYTAAQAIELAATIATNFESLEVIGVENFNAKQLRLFTSQLDMTKALARSLTGNALSLHKFASEEGEDLPPPNPDARPVYDRLINPLKKILQQHHPFDGYSLEAFEFIVLLGVAVGSDRFAIDAPEVFAAAVALIDPLTEMDGEDPISLSNHGLEMVLLEIDLDRACKVLGEAVSPCLSILVPALLRVFLLPAKFDGQGFLGDSEAAFEVLQKFSGMAEGRLRRLAKLGAQFAPYVAAVSRATIELVDWGAFKYGPDGVSAYLACLRGYGVAAMRAHWTSHWSAVKELMARARCREAAFWFAVDAGKCVDLLGPEGVSTEEVNEIGEVIRLLMTRKFDPSSLIADREIRKSETNLYAGIANLISALLETMGANSFRVVDQLLPLLLDTMGVSGAAVLISGCFISHAPEMALVHREPITRLLIDALADDASSDVLEQVARALGFIVDSGVREWEALCERALPLLAAALVEASGENPSMEETLVCALAKITTYCRVYDHLPVILKWLAEVGFHDAYEEEVYMMAVQLFETNPEFYLGDHAANGKLLLRCCRKVLNDYEDDAGDMEKFERVSAILQLSYNEDE